MNEVRVVLVDDEELMRESTRDLLESYDIEVIAEASDGEEAVGLVERFAPDTVLMDINMPGLGGIEATRILRASAPETRVIILSADGSPELRAEAAAAGACEYLEKSSPGSLIVEAIRRNCSIRLNPRTEAVEAS